MVAFMHTGTRLTAGYRYTTLGDATLPWRNICFSICLITYSSTCIYIVLPRNKKHSARGIRAFSTTRIKQKSRSLRALLGLEKISSKTEKLLARLGFVLNNGAMDMDKV